MDLIIFVLVCYGLTSILIYGTIFDKIRPNYKFFYCPLCVGFHVGWFIWLISPYTKLFIFDRSIITAFLLSCLSSGTSYLLASLIDDEGIRIKNVNWKHMDE